MSGGGRGPREAGAVVERARREPPELRPGRRLYAPLLVGTAVGLVGWALGLLDDPARALHGYLFAFVFGVGLALGALGLLLIGHVLRATWLVVVRRLLEIVVLTLPVFAVLFVPVAVGLGEIYPWAHPQELPEPVRENVLKKEAWLNAPFWIVRSVVYLGVWSGLAVWLWRWSLGQDRQEDGSASPEGAVVGVAAVALPVYGFTVSFAAVDWVMSLHPAWYSTIFGLYCFAGAMVGALALTTLLAYAFRERGLLREIVAEDHFHALGKLMLTFLIFWAYMAFSQGLIIWIADLPAEVPWYLARWEDGWWAIVYVLIFGHFLAPFLALLSYRLKRRPTVLAGVAAWLLLMHLVDVYWLVIPALEGWGLHLHWTDPFAFLGVLGAMAVFGLWRLEGHAVVPVGDPLFESSIRYESP